MKKLILLSGLVTLFSLNSSAQAFVKGDILVDVGFGIALYGTDLENSFNGVVEREKDGAASTIVPVKIQYGISNKFSVGAMFQSASYIIDKDSSNMKEDADGITFRVIGSYYFLNKDKLKLYAEFGLGMASYNQNTEDNQNVKSEGEWTGSNFSAGLGMKFYFSKHIGFFANTSYNSYGFDLDNIKVNGTEVSGFNSNLDFSGAEISVGLAVKF